MDGPLCSILKNVCQVTFLSIFYSRENAKAGDLANFFEDGQTFWY